MIPMADLRRGGPALDAALEAAFARVLRSGQYINGPEVAALEAECADYLGVAHAIGVSSGTDALLVALMALDVGPGDEVICPTYSFFATAGAITRVGATPIFVDCAPEGFGLDVEAVRRARTERTRAVIPVHLFGECLELEGLPEGVPVIEDAAQAFGARRGARVAGRDGALGCFSFFPAKNLGALGDGGLVTTQDASLAARVRRLRVHGAEPKYFHEEVGGNFRLDALQAALLRVKLPLLDAAVARRAANAAAYDEAFADLGLGLPHGHEGHVWNQYVVTWPSPEARERARAKLLERGVSSMIYYPVPLHRQACFASLGLAEGSLPRAERLARTSLAIPLFPELEEPERDAVIEAVREAAIVPR